MSSDVSVEIGEDFVAKVQIHRPPHNFFDDGLIRSIADALEELDEKPSVRVILLVSEGKNFCAGADFSGRSAEDPIKKGEGARSLYEQGLRLFGTNKPIIAVVQGAAIGGGLGLALVADFRMGTPESRFAANFAKLGFHHGFGMTVTLPLVVGLQRALEMLYCGERIGGRKALEIGLCDRLASSGQLEEEGRRFAQEIASSAPLAIQSIRRTMRGHLPLLIAEATNRENAEQTRLKETSDFAEGVRASTERRSPHFTGE